MEQPNYLFLWQCIGMIVGVYGVGYWVAASAPAVHWPIVLVGMLGKIFGPVGFVQAHFIDKSVPLHFGVTLLTNDLVWWIPFTLILHHAYKVHEAARLASISTVALRNLPSSGVNAQWSSAMERKTDPSGATLGELSDERPVMLVFLRHMGCTFCREALADVSAQRKKIEAAGTVICLVHMTDAKGARELFAKYALEDCVSIADPDRELYGAFNLRSGSFLQLLGWRSWIRGVSAGIWRRHGVGLLAGDGRQMPGAFVVKNRQVIAGFVHETAADRPDYCELARV